jgi:hypothetical protein
MDEMEEDAKVELEKVGQYGRHIAGLASLC